jgi:hypothetical protein
MIPSLAASALAAAVIPFLIIHHLGSSWNAYYFTLPVTELLLFSFYKTYIYPNFLSPLRHLPQPKGALPLIGHDLALFQQPPAQDFGRWMRELENDGLGIRPAPCETFNNIQDIANVIVVSNRFVSAEFLGPIVCSSQIPRPSPKFWSHELMISKSHLLSANYAESL